MNRLVLFLALLTTGLSAGFWYAWVVSVIIGTKEVEDDHYLFTMQSINRRISNPAFFIIFWGPCLLLPFAAFLNRQEMETLPFVLFLTGTLLYFIGPIGVTLFGNVPLNNQLDRLELQALNNEEKSKFRKIYETKWNRLHYLRTFLGVLSFIILVALFIF